MIVVLTEIYNMIWRAPWTQSLIITLPRKSNLQLCHNYRTISHLEWATALFSEHAVKLLELIGIVLS